jgi:hypothetical protein
MMKVSKECVYTCGPRVGVTGVLLVDTCFFKINKYLVINKVWYVYSLLYIIKLGRL